MCSLINNAAGEASLLHTNCCSNHLFDVLVAQGRNQHKPIYLSSSFCHQSAQESEVCFLFLSGCGCCCCCRLSETDWSVSIITVRLLKESTTVQSWSLALIFSSVHFSFLFTASDIVRNLSPNNRTGYSLWKALTEVKQMCKAATTLLNNEQMMILWFQFGPHGDIPPPGNRQMLTRTFDLDQSSRLLSPVQLLCYQTNFQPDEWNITSLMCIKLSRWRLSDTRCPLWVYCSCSIIQTFTFDSYRLHWRMSHLI